MLYSSAAGSDLRHLRGLLPVCVRLGPAWFRRKILDAFPSSRIQRVKYIIDTVHDGCRKLLAEKRAALTKGDQELLHAVGEGKDIMSVLRAFSSSLRGTNIAAD